MVLSDLVAAAILLAYYIFACALLPTTLRVWARVPGEYVRKLQHVAYSLSVFILLQMFSTWYAAVLSGLLLVVVAYPFLLIMERTRLYRRLFVDREDGGGELRRQLIYVQVSFALLIFLCWGLLGTKWQYVVGVSVMAWGFGDAAAALVGKALGRRKALFFLVEKTKTYEGTVAMIAVAGVAAFLTLMFFGQQPWYISLPLALLVAPVCGVVELFSRRGLDTITVPLAAALLLLNVSYICLLFGR